MIYLDYAATSFPKPPKVIEAMKNFLETSAGNPGRSGHDLSIAAAKVLFEARDLLAEFFNCQNPERVILNFNATYASNICLNSFLKPGDKVVTTSLEHNAVMRPLRLLEKKGIKLTVVQNNPDGTTNLEKINKAVTPDTKLVVVNHASNICGIIQPIKEISEIAHKNNAKVFVDAAQTAGILKIDMQADNIDFLILTGHKGLHGPTGTGGLLINDTVDVKSLSPFITGGTGSRSEDEIQPEYLPDMLESGTANTVGFAGLIEGINFIKEKTLGAILEYEKLLSKTLIEGLLEIPSVEIYGNLEPTLRTSVISMNIKGKTCTEVAGLLNDKFSIMCRSGMHCAPSAHKTLGTFPQGTVRLSPGLYTTLDDIHATLAAIREIAS